MIRLSMVAQLVVAGLLLAGPSMAQADFGFVPGSVSATANERDGSIDARAGSHPYSYTVHFALQTEFSGATVGGQARDFIVNLPPGFVGNPRAVPACPRQLFEGGTPQCSANSQVGVLRASIASLGEVVGPIYSLEPPPGVAAQLAFSTFNFNNFQNASVRSGEGYGLSVGAFNLPLEVTEASETIWGVPADPAHFSERFCRIEGGNQIEGCSSESSLVPFLTLPTTCDSPLQVAFKADSGLAPGVFAEQSAFAIGGGEGPATLVGCEAVPFAPLIMARPTASEADSPSGLDFELRLPNKGLAAPGSITETEPEKTEVTLPLGVTINPSAANGIVGCTAAQYLAANGEPDVGCPEASKVGTLVANTSLLEEPIRGAVYLAAPHDNPFDSLLALYIVAKAPVRGVLVKQAGLVQADATTGQLTATFDDLPPLPYSSFELGLREGPRAPLITPQACGEYSTVAKLHPFSAPHSPVERTAPFMITSGAYGTGCSAVEAQQPNEPSFEAGTAVPVAGSYSSFVFRVRRRDGDQRFSSLRANLPQGLLGKLAGVPYCPEAGIATAASRAAEGGGAAELISPSCPLASQVGIVSVGAGAGSQPYTVQGKVYLAGPYKGAPLSLEIITPAIAGPFDLGSVAVRTALKVNPITAQIDATSDPLPSILHGIPLDVRSISLQLDRPQFVLNPTNCGKKSITGTTVSLVGQSAPLADGFSVGGCNGLEFKPRLALTLKGSTQRGKNPALKAVLTQPQGQANIARVSVTLPKNEFIDNRHISNPCTRVQFNAGAGNGAECPAKSILGRARAVTPLLDDPLEGPVYFRSNGGERDLPDLVASLDGQVHLNLVGFIDSVHKKRTEISRTRNTFAMVPDAPVSRFVLELKGGKKGLLQNSANLCNVADVAGVSFRGQNGKASNGDTAIGTSCRTGVRHGGQH